MNKTLIVTVVVMALVTTSRPAAVALPAARVGDYHSCPLVTGGTPHVGGPILTGASTVLICGAPAARVTSIAACNGPADTVIGGSGTVLIEGAPAARLTDPTAHGGVVEVGCGTVLIGS